jgi:hypothetical protein
MDEDLQHLNCDQLIAEVRRLRGAIRAHRDSAGHDLCWYHPELWDLLPEKGPVQPWVPTWPKFLLGCVRYRASLDREIRNAPRRGIGHGQTPPGDAP